MKTLIIIISITFCVTAWAQELKILNLNFQCEKNLELKVIELVNKIKKEKVDTLILQEFCDSNDLKSELLLKSKLSHKWILKKFYTHAAWDKYDEYLVIATSRKIQDIKYGTLSYSPLLRGFLSLKISNLWITNTHLTHTSSSNGYRRAQACDLAKIFNTKQAIIIGDFNAPPKSNDFSCFLKNGFKSIFPFPTYPSSRPQIKYDGLWTSSFFDFKLNIKKIFSKPILNSTYISDHIGFIIELK